MVQDDDIVNLRAIANAAMGVEKAASAKISEMLAPMLRSNEADRESAALLIAAIANARIAALSVIHFSTRTAQLSSMQLDILGLIADGKTNIEISIIVGRSKRSIDYQVIKIVDRLDVSSRAQAAAIFSTR